MTEQLPSITRAKIGQAKLKHSDEKVRHRFAQSVLKLINPKFESKTEADIAFGILMDFSADSELTEAEYIIALKEASKGRLITEDANGNLKPVRLFREIDFIKLNEIEQAYIQYRNQDKQHELGEAKINRFLTPQRPELSDEQKKAERMKFYQEEWKRLQDRGVIFGTIVFYELIKTEVEKVKLSFLEAVLDSYKPENKKGIVGEIVQQNPKIHFINHFVIKFIKAHKLKALSLEDWKQYWEKKHEKRKQTNL